MTGLIALLLLIALATPAEAGPVFSAIGGLLTAIKGFAAINVFTGWLVKTAASIALSRLAMALRGRPRAAGITTESTTTGGTTPQKFILGLYATAGQLVAPPMSYGSAGKTPRAYLVYVVALSCLPGVTLQRVIINDAYVPLGASGANWGKPATGAMAGHAWVDFRDGTQTVAHADLLTAFASDPDRPWMADMVGPGTAYAVARFKYNREVFNGLPSVRFECLGIPLYDPRQDSSVGGSGAHRWSTPATWAQTSNPAVMIYNILRGITLPDGQVWGGAAEAEDLPLSGWFAAMNECDLPIALAAGGTEPQFRAGIEIALDNEPASVIEELLKACSGQIVEIGGVWKMRCGAPAMPVLTITDDDILVSSAQELEPFPGLSATWNGIGATYPDPETLWEPKEAPPRYNPTWETEDGGRRRVADLRLGASPYPLQVQRLMASYIADERRHRRHRFALPPEAAVLEPLDTIAWTSVRIGYETKLFELTGLTDNLMTITQGVQLRECDPADYDWTPSDEIAVAPVTTETTPPAAQAVPGFAVSAAAVVDGAAADRRPAIKLLWDADAADDATGLQWQVRLSGATEPQLAGTFGSVSAGGLIVSSGILADQSYEVRVRFIVDRATAWTDWEPVTTAEILLGRVDFNGVYPQAGVVGPVTMAHGTQVHCTLAWGPTGASSIWLRGVTFRARRVSGALATVTLKLQRRTKEGGTWSAWIDRNTWDITSSAWDQYTSSATVVGNYQDVEERLLSDCSDDQINGLSDITMIATDIIK